MIHVTYFLYTYLATIEHHCTLAALRQEKRHEMYVNFVRYVDHLICRRVEYRNCDTDDMITIVHDCYNARRFEDTRDNSICMRFSFRL